MIGMSGSRKHKMWKAAVSAALCCGWSMAGSIAADAAMYVYDLESFDWNRSTVTVDRIVRTIPYILVYNVARMDPYNEPESGTKLVRNYNVFCSGLPILYLEVRFEDGKNTYSFPRNKQYVTYNIDLPRSRVTTGNGAKIEFNRTDQLRIASTMIKSNTNNKVYASSDTNYALYYTLGTSYATYKFADEGITWTPDASLITADRKISLDRFTVDWDSLKIKNFDDVKKDEKISLVNLSAFTDVFSLAYDFDKATFQKTATVTNRVNLTKAVSADKSIDFRVYPGGQSELLLTAASDPKYSAVNVELNKIGADSDSSDAWTPGGTLYSISDAYDYGDVSVNFIQNGGIAGGALGESMKPGTSMTLLDISGTNTDAITTQIDGAETSDETIQMNAVDFTDAADAGITAMGSHADTLAVTKDASHYQAVYTIGRKLISSFGQVADGIDLSKEAGGFVADNTYEMIGNNVINVGDSAWTWLNRDKVGNLTLIDVTNAAGGGTLSVKSDEGAAAGNKATLAGESYEGSAENGVKISGTQHDLLFSVDETGKKLSVSGFSLPTAALVTLETVDLSKDAYTCNAIGSGTVNASQNIYFTGKTLADVANGGNYVLLKAAEGSQNTFGNWNFALGKTGSNFYVEQETGITGTVSAGFDTADGNINVATNGLTALTFGENIAWDTSKTAVTLDGGRLETIDFSHISFTGTDGKEKGTMRLLDAQKMIRDTTITAPTGWTSTKVGGKTTYTGNVREEKVTQEDGVSGGISLSVDRVDEVVATKSQNNQKFTLDYKANNAYAKTFSIGNGIKWVKDGTAISLSEQYDYSQMTNVITFDASNPYKLIANPDEVGIGESMTFFDAAGYMTNDEWADKVSIVNASGSSEPYRETDRAVTLEGNVNLELTKNDNKTVTGKISDEYLSKVAIDLSKIGNEETAEKNKWVNGGTLYSQTASTQDYGDANKKVTVSIDDTKKIFGGTTDESVKAGDKMTLVHIEGKNAGDETNFAKFDTTADLNFKDTAANGITATGTHTDKIESSAVPANDGTKGKYDVVYTVGTKTVSAIAGGTVDLRQDAFTTGNQYTLGGANITVDTSKIIIGNTGNGTRKAIIDFSGDSGTFSLSSAEAAVDYAETSDDAVNGVWARGKETNQFSLSEDAKTVYWDSSEKTVNTVVIGTVDLSKDVRSFKNLAASGTIQTVGAIYGYTENKEIADVVGKIIKIVGVTDGNRFNSKNWTVQSSADEIVSVNQEPGIRAVVNATYNMDGGDLNLNTSGLALLAFEENINWEKGVTAVSLSGQDIERVDFSEISFADTETKKNETMRLLSAQNMTENIGTITYDTAHWTNRAGTTIYDKDNRTHDDNDNLIGYGITLTVDRGDQIVWKTTKEDTKFTSCTLDYTRGKGYVKGMTIADAGITWANGETAITLDEDYDFSEAGTLTFPADKISNVSTLQAGDSMTFFDANGKMSDTDWENVIKIDSDSQTAGEYTNQATKAVTVTGNIGINLAKEDTKKVTATVSEQNMNTIAIDLSKIGKAGDDTDAWDTETALYTNTTSGQDYAVKNVSVSVDNTKKIFGGTTDESVKTGDTMTLLDITGTHAAGENALTDISQTSEVSFKDTQGNGLIVTGKHTDTIASSTTASSDGPGNYKLIYTVGQKLLGSDSTITAEELDLTKEAFTAGNQYVLQDLVHINTENLKIKNIGDGTKKAIIDFSEATGTGSFVLANADNQGCVSDTVSYTESEDQAVNGIRAAGNQYRTFSVSENGKIVCLDSAAQDVSRVNVGYYVDVAEDVRHFTNLTASGTVETEEIFGLDNQRIAKAKGKNVTLATAEGEHTFADGWTIPEGTKDVYARQEEGVIALFKGAYNADDGNLNVKINDLDAIYFYEGLAWRDDAVIDLAGTGINLTEKIIDASELSFSTDSVKNIVKTDGAYQMVLINTDEENHLDAAKITNNENIAVTLDDTVTFKGKTELSADKKQFIASMDRETAIAAEQTHHNVMVQNAAMNAVATGTVQTTDAISTTLHDFDEKDLESGAIFAHIGGSSTETETGSHVASNMWNVDVGITTGKEYVDGRADYALYYEGGFGNYTTHDDAATTKEMSGELKYHGAGFLFRYENKNHVYGEAGFHAGRIGNENHALGIDNSAAYYGGHVGVGKILNVGENQSVDMYAKFYMNRTGGINYGNDDSKVKLDAVTSKLLRIGGRYNRKMNANYMFYTGAAFAYEFGGKAEGEVTHSLVSDALDIRPASTRGASAFLELGFKKEATKTDPWEIDLGFKGYMGRRKGIGANIGFKYHF